jgi:hypothetical protein
MHDIMQEGDSVILRCLSDANPPAKVFINFAKKFTRRRVLKETLSREEGLKLR